MMPYRSVHNQSRVEYIKNKFESSFSEGNKTTKNTNNTNSYPSKVLLDLKALTAEKSAKFDKNDVKGDGKSHIKRTPAFRREKLGCLKNFEKESSKCVGCDKNLSGNTHSDNSRKICKGESDETLEKSNEKLNKQDLISKQNRTCVVNSSTETKKSTPLNKSLNPIGYCESTEIISIDESPKLKVSDKSNLVVNSDKDESTKDAVPHESSIKNISDKLIIPTDKTISSDDNCKLNVLSEKPVNLVVKPDGIETTNDSSSGIVLNEKSDQWKFLSKEISSSISGCDKTPTIKKDISKSNKTSSKYEALNKSTDNFEKTDKFILSDENSECEISDRRLVVNFKENETSNENLNKLTNSKKLCNTIDNFGKTHKIFIEDKLHTSKLSDNIINPQKTILDKTTNENIHDISKKYKISPSKPFSPVDNFNETDKIKSDVTNCKYKVSDSKTGFDFNKIESSKENLTNVGFHEKLNKWKVSNKISDRIDNFEKNDKISNDNKLCISKFSDKIQNLTSGNVTEENINDISKKSNISINKSINSVDKFEITSDDKFKKLEISKISLGTSNEIKSNQIEENKSSNEKSGKLKVSSLDKTPHKVSEKIKIPLVDVSSGNLTESESFQEKLKKWKASPSKCLKSLEPEKSNILFDDFKSIKRSKTDLNFQNCDNESLNLVKSTLISKSHNLLGQTDNDSPKKIVPQYSAVNKPTKNDSNEKEELKLSESIRRALQSPLPKGPPPKKPPRTFCHVPGKSPPLKPATPKTDIPKLKSKLDKLEKVIRIHGNSKDLKVSNEHFKKDLEKTLNKISKTDESVVSLSKVARETNENQFCLFFSNCLNQSTNSHVYEKLRKNSKLSSDLNSLNMICTSVSDKNTELNDVKGQKPAIVPVEEPVYDLPCVNKKPPPLQTFGRSSKEDLSLKSKKPEEGLHYMCADVSQIHLLSPHELNFDSRNHEDGDKNLGSGVRDKINQSKNDENALAARGLNMLKTKAPSEPPIFVSVDAGLSSDGPVSGIKESEKMSQRIITSKESFNKVPYWKNITKNNYKHLFESCLLVGLTLSESKGIVPYIKSAFPSGVNPPPLIESLCFPDASDWPPSSEHQIPEEQYYSLVVTNQNGDRKFGYCRRVLPEGGHFCLPLAYCIISPHRANGFFYKVLQELESRHGSPGIENFIKQLYECEFPSPGERLKLKKILEEATRSTPLTAPEYLPSTLVRRPCDIRLEEKDLTQLLQLLELRVFFKIFSSLLVERKVLLVSNSLRKLSSCIEALQSVLLPFSWQHTYIPVLPVQLIEICEAPTPYVIGLLKPKNGDKCFSTFNFEHGIFVDLDDSTIIKCCGDEDNILPSKLVKDLTTALNSGMNAFELSETNRNVLISDAFIRFFVQLCGSYHKFLKNSPEGHFKKEEFIKSVTSSALQSFLEKFTETAMFSAFIHERLSGHTVDVPVKLFISRALEYSRKIIKT